eukprot:SAG11_NODE_1021_length_6157_cov_1.321063_2_plen_122_part_00
MNVFIRRVPRCLLCRCLKLYCNAARIHPTRAMILIVGRMVPAMMECVTVKRDTLGNVVMFSIHVLVLIVGNMGNVMVVYVSAKTVTLGRAVNHHHCSLAAQNGALNAHELVSATLLVALSV